MADENANDEAAVLDPALEGNGALETETFVEGDNANLEPAGVLPPGTEEQELTIEELREMSKRLDAGLPLVDEKPKTKVEKDTLDDDEDEPKPKAAEGPKGKRIRTTIDHLSETDQEKAKAILDLTRKGESFEQAAFKILKAKTAERNKEAEEIQKILQEEEANPQAENADPVIAAMSELEAAEEAEQLAEDNFDREAKIAARKAVREAMRKLSRAESLAEARQERMTQRAEAEAAQVRTAIPEFTDPESLLTLAYNHILGNTPEKEIGPGSAMQIAEQAWKKVYPTKPFPANGAARQPARIVQPPQNGRPAAALATDGGTRTTVADFLKNPDARSKEELLEIAAGL